MNMAMTLKEILDRKESALDESIDWLREEGEYKRSSRNGMIADNEVKWELGEYDEPPPTKEEILASWDKKEEAKITESEIQGLIVRTRRDALASKLNTSDILNTLDGDDAVAGIRRDLQHIKIACGLILGILVVMKFL